MALTAHRHLIWDWNGTLLDDLDLSVDVMNTLLARRGLPHGRLHKTLERVRIANHSLLHRRLEAGRE